jgi:hypothetical protein
MHHQFKFLQLLKRILGPDARGIFDAEALDEADELQIGTQRKDLRKRQLHSYESHLCEAPAHLLQHLLDQFLFRIKESKLGDCLELVEKAKHVSTRHVPVHAMQFRQLTIGVGVHLPSQNDLLQAQIQWLHNDWIVVAFQ